MWTPYGVLLDEFIFPVFQGGFHVVQMEQLESNRTPHGVHMDSGQKIGWATTKKKMSKVHMDSRDWPGLHMESVGDDKVLLKLHTKFGLGGTTCKLVQIWVTWFPPH